MGYKDVRKKCGDGIALTVTHMIQHTLVSAGGLYTLPANDFNRKITANSLQ